MRTLISLPVELLYEIQLFAISNALPQTCKAVHSIFKYSPPSYRAQYLVACTNASHTHKDIVLTKILRYPICTKDVLDIYFRWEDPSKKQSSPELPRRLFRALVRNDPIHRDWSERDPPLPFLGYLYSLPHLPAPNVNSHDGYALTKAVLAGFIPLVQFLLDHGATPTSKDNLPITIAIHRKDLDLVRMLVERIEIGKSSSRKSNGKRRKLEDRIEVTPEMLRIAVKCKAQDIVEYLTREKGCIPDMQTLLLMG